MNFLNPILAGVGLACIAVPILIHLLMRRRRRPVPWAAMRFLLEAYRQHNRRLKLEQFLLLASRCLLIALVALALGRPLLGSAGLLGGRGAVTLHLLVDNSLASSAEDADGPALQRHKTAARSLLDQLDPAAGDRASLLALGGPSQALVSPPSSNIAAVGDILRSLAPTDSPADIPGAIASVRESLHAPSAGGDGTHIVVILSDFLAGSADTERTLADLARRDDLLLMASSPAAAAPPNVGIAGLEPLRPVLIAGPEQAAQQTPVRVLLRRSGSAASEAAATTVRLGFSIDGPGGTRSTIPAGETVVRWAAGQTEVSAAAVADLTPATRAVGTAVLTASIDADAVAGDNTWRRPIDVRRSLRVGLVATRRLGARPSLQQYEPADWIRIALQPGDSPRGESEIEIADIDPASLDTPRLAGLDAAIIAAPDAVPEAAWRKVRAFADTGGLVLVVPPARGTVHVWSDPMTRELGLPWTISREAHAWPEGTKVAGERPPLMQGPDLLSLVASELAELAAPARVWRALRVEGGAGQKAPGALLALADGSPLLLAAPPGSRDSPQSGTPIETQRGLVVLLTTSFAFDWTDLQAKPLMVPLVQEVVRQGVGRARGEWVALAGKAPTLPPRTLELRALGGASPSTVKASGDRAAEPIRHAGLWRAVDDSGAGRGIVAVNADPAGGRCEPQTAGAIGTWLATAVGNAEVRWLDAKADVAGEGGGSLRSTLQRGEDGSRFVLPLLIAALAVALLELALARWFSHAVVTPGEAPAGAAA